MLVLNYHHVHDEEEGFFRVTTRQFERQMLYIRDCGYTFVTLDQFLERPDAPASVLVTFDDGYEDVYLNAAPILKRLGIPAVMFLIAGYLGGWNDWDTCAPSRRRHMDPEQIEDLLRDGWAPGSHSASHPNLLDVTPEVLDSEVRGSREFLETVTGSEIRVFAYPGGHVDSRVRLSVSKSFEAGFSVRGSRGDLFRIPRFDPSFGGISDHVVKQGSWGFLASAP